MSYSLVPAASGDTLVNTRDPIRTNFEVLQNRFQDNHTDFSSGTGKHKFLQMPEQSSAPATAVDEGGFYTKSATGTNLFFASENNGEEYQLTTVSDSKISEFGTNTNYSGDFNGGWTFLPGGLIMQYGYTNTLASTTVNTITLPVTYSTAIYSVNATPLRENTTSPGSTFVFFVDFSTLTTSTFDIINRTTHSYRWFWQVIGK